MPAAAEVDLALKIIDQATGPLNRIVGSINQGFSRITSVARIAGGAFGALSFGMVAKEALEMADRMTLLSSRLQIVGADMESVFRVSQDTSTSLAATAQLYTRMARATQDLGYSQEQLIQTVKTINEAIIVSGASTQEASAALLQLSQALAYGKLRGQEFRSVMSQAPAVMEMIAAHFQVATKDLQQLADQGKISTQDMMDAIAEAGDSMHQQFESMHMTVGQSITIMSNALGMFIEDLNEGTGATGLLAESITGLAGVLDSVREGLHQTEGAWGVFNQAIAGTVYLVREAWAGLEFLFTSLTAYLKSAAGGFNELGWIIWSAFTNNLDGIKTHFRNFMAYINEAPEITRKAWEDMGKASEDAITKLYRDLGKLPEIIGPNTAQIAQRRLRRLNTTLNQLGTEGKTSIDNTAKAMKRLHDIEIQLFPDSEIGRIQRIHAHFQDLREEITDLAFAMNMELDEYERFMDMVGKKEDEQVAKVHSASYEIIQTHHEAIQEVSRGWENAYNQITNFLEDWISGSKFIVSSFIDWIKHAFAQVAATSIVGSIAGGLGLPGAAAWAGQGGLSLAGAAGAAGSAGSLWDKIQTAGGIGSWLMGGLTSAGNTLMYGVPEALLSMGFEDTAFMLGSMSPALMGGLTAGLGTFLMQGLFSGDWAKAAVSGSSTGIGAGVGALAGGPVGAVVGGLIGALGGGLLGGLFGDGTERTYLQQAMTTSYGPGGFRWGEPRTRRWDCGEPDWMDQILDIQGQLQDQLKGLFDGVVDTLGKLTPGLKDRLAGWSSDFLMSWSAETKDEVQEDLEKNIQNFAKYQLSPVIDLFKEDLAKGISGLDLSVFTDEFKQGFTDHIQQLMDQLDFSNIDSIEELERALKDLGATVDEIDQMEEYVGKVNEIQQSFKDALEPTDAYHQQLKKVNEEFLQTKDALLEMGVDLEKFPELASVWKDSILKISEDIYGVVMALPAEINENWDRVTKDILGMNLSQPLVDLLNKVMTGDMKLEEVGSTWASQIQKSMKDAVLSEFVDFGTKQISDALLAPLTEGLLGKDFNAESLEAAFGGIDTLGTSLEIAGQGLAEITNYIQETGNIKGFNWEEWQESFGASWDKINQANAEREQRAEDAAKASIEAATALKGSATALNQSADYSAKAIDGAAARVQQPPNVNVDVYVDIDPAEANYG